MYFILIQSYIQFSWKIKYLEDDVNQECKIHIIDCQYDLQSFDRVKIIVSFSSYGMLGTIVESI